MKKSIKKRLVWLGLFILAAAGAFLGLQYRDVLRDLFLDDTKYDYLIVRAARKYGIDSRLVKAVIYRESRFNPSASGNAGEIGLMQIMPKFSVQDWAKDHGVEPPTAGMLYSPQLNIEIGTWYLAKAMAQWRNFKYGTELALCHYNAGDKRAQSWKPESYDGEIMSRIKIKSTKNYVEAIMKKYQEYCKKGVMQP